MGLNGTHPRPASSRGTRSDGTRTESMPPSSRRDTPPAIGRLPNADGVLHQPSDPNACSPTGADARNLEPVALQPIAGVGGELRLPLPETRGFRQAGHLAASVADQVVQGFAGHDHGPILSQHQPVNDPLVLQLSHEPIHRHRMHPAFAGDLPDQRLDHPGHAGIREKLEHPPARSGHRQSRHRTSTQRETQGLSGSRHGSQSARQLRKPSVNALRSRLRPMNTSWLVRSSFAFQGRSTFASNSM